MLLRTLAIVLGFAVSLVSMAVAQDAARAPVPKSGSGRIPGHRNLFNGDCTFLFQDGFVADLKAPYDKQTLAWFIDVLADNGVDTYLVNPNAQVPWFPSKRTRNILTGYRRGDREFFRGHLPPNFPEERAKVRLDEWVTFLNRYLDLAEAGVDWVAEMSAHCRRRGISPWISIRMNDMHGANSWEGSFMNCDLQKDPRFRLSGREVNPRDGINRMLQPLNYAHPEVRDYMLLQIRELVEEYDFEGLELDWLRCPFCCETPATPENRATMLQWIREIRKLTQARSEKTGKPYPLGLRIPCRLGLLKEIGLDVKAMADAGLIDFVGCGNFWQTAWDVPYDELRRELGGKVALLGVIDDAPNWLTAREPESKKQSFRLLTASPELLRGNAAGKLALGVDGIEQFNFFCSDEGPHTTDLSRRQARYPALKGIENLEGLRGQPKQYALATQRGLYSFPLWELAEQVPAILEPEWKKAFRLSMCAEPAQANLELTVQLVVERTETLPDLGVSFNGSWPTFESVETDRLLFPTGVFTHHIAEHRGLNFRVPVSAIKEGWNEVLVLNGSHKRATLAERRENSAIILSVELAVCSPIARQ